jgi:hypothetical protein
MGGKSLILSSVNEGMKNYDVPRKCGIMPSEASCLCRTVSFL